MPPTATFFLLLGALLFITLVPSGGSGFNRSYHIFVRTPNDLGPQIIGRIFNSIAPHTPPYPPDYATIALGQLAFATRNASSDTGGNVGLRITSYLSATRTTPDILAQLRHFPETIFVPLTGHEFYTAASSLALLSGHWRPQIVSIGAVGGPEFEQNATGLGYRKLGAASPQEYLHQSALNKSSQP